MKLQSLVKAAAFSIAAVAASAALANGTAYRVAPAAAPQGAYNGAGFVLGAQAGYADTHWDNLNESLNAFGQTFTTELDSKGFAGRLFAGYDFNHYFGAELGYIYLPKVDVKINGDKVGDIKNYAVDLLGKLNAPIANGFSVYAKAGVAYLKSSANDNADDNLDSTSHVGPAFGVGLAYQITPQFSADLSWTRYSGEGKLQGDYQPNPDVFLVGVSYKFPVDAS